MSLSEEKLSKALLLIGKAFTIKTLRVGILGDGQLAKMLVEAAYPLGIAPVIYSDSNHTPLKEICPHIIQGDRQDSKALSKFFSRVEVIVFESEFFEKKDLQQAFQRSGKKVVFVPALETMEKLRDKLSQKKLLQNLHIPTARFIELKEQDAIFPWLQAVSNKLKKDFVLKWGRLGYDGKGVFFPLKKDFSSAITFCEKAREAGVSLYAEEKISFKKELALTACYSTKNEFVAYPLVISHQKNGVCVQVVGPATTLGVSPSIQKKAQDYAEKLARKLQVFGCFTLELFQDRRGELLVNEIAPRVHNSAHYSQNASATSQFENHLRAALGLPLGNTKSAPFFSMLNLLAPENVSGTNDSFPRPKLNGKTHLHWYGKKFIRPGRKIGHLNAVAYSTHHSKKVLADLTKIHKDWIKQIKENATKRS